MKEFILWCGSEFNVGVKVPLNIIVLSTCAGVIPRDAPLNRSVLEAWRSSLDRYLEKWCYIYRGLLELNLTTKSLGYHR